MSAFMDRAQSRMAEPCRGCGKQDWVLAKMRRSNSSYAIDLQCMACGRSGGQPFAKSEHPNWEDYPEFDHSISERRRAAWLTEFEQGHDARSAEYHRWLDTSPEWHVLRQRVLQRAQGVCECCLNARAVQVHHKSYSYGWLPPAFELVAVCLPCHDKLHSWPDEREKPL